MTRGRSTNLRMLFVLDALKCAGRPESINQIKTTVYIKILAILDKEYLFTFRNAFCQRYKVSDKQNHVSIYK